MSQRGWGAVENCFWDDDDDAVGCIQPLYSGSKP